jgi:diguanylate cyclase (GGDEF)-like protein
MRLASRKGLGLAAFLTAFAVSALLASGAESSRPGLGESLFSSIGTRDGLPNASVSGIAQDSQGFLWFATQGGLARYDGYSFKLFRHAPFDEGSLPHDLVQTLYLDRDALWVGTYGGLARFDPRSERFTSYSSDSSRADSLSNDVVTCIARDAKGSLWVGTLGGLNRLDEAKGSFTRFMHDPADPASLPSDVVRAIRVDREGRLWIGTSGGGLARFDYSSSSFASYRADKSRTTSILSDYVMAIEQDPHGRLWIGTWYGGLSSLDPATGRFSNHPMADDRVYALCASEDGTLYVGTWGGGLFEFDIASESFSRYRASGSSGSLSSDVVYSLLRDAAGELWIGTNGGGVCKLGVSRRGYEAVSSSPGGLPSGKIYAVLLDRRGCLWVSVYNEGLARRDPGSGAWRFYRHEAGRPGSLPNDIVNFLQEDGSGDIWAGTNDGLARYDRPSDSFATLKPRPGRSDSLSSEVIYSMSEDPSGGLWIGTFRSGLDYWDRKTGSLAHYRHESGREDSLSDNMVTALGRDSQGRLWVGTNRGLDRFEGPGADGKGRFVRYEYDPARSVGISSDSIRTIFMDSRNVLWIGTAGGGIMRYEAETDSFVSYTIGDGLPSNMILRIVEDGSGDLWVSTQVGIAVYDRVTGRFRNLTVYGDLKNTEFFSGAFRAADGSLYFGAMSRLYRFDPARYEFNVHRPPVAFTSIAVKGRAAVGATAASGLGRLDLSWRENSLTFEFAALDYRDSELNRYSYRLEGFDSDWSSPGAGHTASYTNLPGGSYLFRVRAANNDGLWNEEGLALPLRVGYAPWANPFVLALAALLLAGAGYAIGSSSPQASLRALRSEAEGLRAKLVAVSASMESAAIVDQLTGLPNRRKVEEHLELALARASSRKLELALLMVDIDHFKAYNDRYGRNAGDECLRRVAGEIASRLKRSSDVAARYGGEEFLVVLEETGREGAHEEGESLRRAIEALGLGRVEDRSREGRDGPALTVSIGCAFVQPEEEFSPTSLIAAAERALLAAKQLGRNRVSD